MEKKNVITPMIRQYLDIKKEYKDAILFFRLGDFYEMFFDEAIEVSRILGLTLTKRNDVPMCGIPYHAYKVYVARLLRAGKKIAICEQVSEPLPGELTKREVTEVITAGIATEDDFLDAGSNNYLMAIYSPKKKGEEKTHSIAYIDVSLGAFYVSSFFAKDFEKELFKEIGRLNPSELLFQESLNENDAIIKRLNLECPNVLKTAFSDALFNGERAFEKLCRLFGTESLKAFGLEKDSECLPAAAIIIEYLENTSKNLLLHINSIKKIEEDEFLSIDYSTRKNLELTSNLNDGTSSYTLLEVINHTKTSMGTRLLKRRIEEPICNTAELEKRLEGVTALIKNERTFREIRSSLSLIADIQRLGGRIAMEKAGARDLLILSRSLKEALRLISLITKGMFGILSLTWDETNCISQIYQLLNSSINENVTSSTADIGIIKDGYNKEVDRLREVHNNAQKILEEYVLSERKKTGIQNLKIKYNKLIGYFLEVSKSHWEKAPEYFIKKRSISNSDRYTTEKLEKIVAEITGAEDALMKLEKSLFIEVRAKVAKENATLQKLAEKVAELDVLQSFADVAKLNNWACPHFTSDGSLKIVGGRHPVVESHLPRGEFIPNSISLSSNIEKDSFELKESFPSFAIITGPNMAGKSTFLRQTALIVLLSQMGSYVPADEVSLTPCDKIFCRVGSQDNLARGESTFLVEMTETSYILQTATKKSLVIMDEVGRGTSTEDGLSIAQACCEYLLEKIGAKTLFATHYRELTELNSEKLINLKLDIMEKDGKIIFLKKVVEGSSKSSYGLHVAELAGLPKEVLERAKNLLHMRNAFAKAPASLDAPLVDEKDGKNENASTEKEKQKKAIEHKNEPMLFGEELLVINDILSQDLNNITPLKALQKLNEWQKSLM